MYLDDYKPTFPSVTYPRHALVVPAGVITFLKELKHIRKKTHKLIKISQSLSLVGGLFHKSNKQF